VVEEELLELIEHEHELPAQRCGPAVDPVGQVTGRLAGIAAERLRERAADGLVDAQNRIARPRAVVGDSHRLGRGELP